MFEEFLSRWLSGCRVFVSGFRRGAALRSSLEATAGDGEASGAEVVAGRMAAWKKLSGRHRSLFHRGPTAGTAFLPGQGGMGESCRAAVFPVGGAQSLLPLISFLEKERRGRDSNDFADLNELPDSHLS